MILKRDPLPWLLEDDPLNPGVRYLALLQLLGKPADAKEVVAARKAVMNSGPAPVILAQQHTDGYWVKPGYLPKYNGAMWSTAPR